MDARSEMPTVSPDPSATRDVIATATARLALGIFVAANLVGLWMAALLIWPDLGRLTLPVSYGRLAPVHMELQLYGWCSLPAIGVLLVRALPETPAAAAWGRIALAAWTGSLLAGALDWLAGGASGKLFLSWAGLPRVGFILVQLLLWSVLAAGWLHPHRRRHTRRTTWLAGMAILAMLLFVPAAMWIAADPAVYPPINPHSGGATGHSLLASSLGIIGIALLLPLLLGRPPAPDRRGTGRWMVAAYAAGWLVYLGIGHGHASNHRVDQIAGLATLLAWPPLLIAWYRRRIWPVESLRWLRSAAAWAVFLTIDGWVLFLPGILDGAKFGNALVAHSHLAMAGLLTSLSMIMLTVVGEGRAWAVRLGDRSAWILWNAGCLAMVLVLTWLGWLEAHWSLTGLRDAALLRIGYGARLAAGFVMAAASLFWLRAALASPCPDAAQPAVSLPVAHETASSR